jgi:ABC-type glycerol-3-phosphate transport system permease component
MSAARPRRRPVHGLLLALIVAYSLFPIYMLAVESVKTVDEDVFGSPLYVLRPSLEWYTDLFEPMGWVRNGAVVPQVPFLIWAKNTGIVFGAALAVILIVSVMAAYALGRLRPPGWRWWRRALFASYLIPQTLLFLPLYQIVFRLHLDDSLAALVLVYPMLAVPFCIWLLSAYFQRLSPDVEESAYIEGASRVTAFLRIVLPMSWPVVVAAGIFALGVLSSDFMFASVFLPNQAHQTLAAGLGTMSVSLEDLTVIAGVNLAALLVVPVCAMFSAAYVRGLTAAMLEGA